MSPISPERDFRIDKGSKNIMDGISSSEPIPRAEGPFDFTEGVKDVETFRIPEVSDVRQLGAHTMDAAVFANEIERIQAENPNYFSA